MGIIAAMEELDEGLVGDESAVAQAETAAEVAQGETEVVEEAGEIEGDVADLDGGIQGSEELQAIGEVAADAVESGEGLPEEAAQVATIAIESICQRLGFKDGHRVVPATESFGQTNTRLASTKMIVENVGDKIKSIWNAIKAMAKRLWDKVVQFFAKIFNSAKVMSKHLVNLRERAKALDSSAKPKEKTLKNESLAKQLSVGKKADLNSYVTLAKNAEKLVVVAQGVSKVRVELANEYNALATASEINEAEMKKFIDAKKKKDSDMNKVISSSLDALDATSLAGLQVTGEKGAKTTLDGFGPFVGSEALVYESGESGDISFIRIGFRELKKKDVAKAAEALDVGGVLRVIDQAESLANRIEDFQTVKKNMDTISSSIEKTAEVVIKNASKMVEKSGSSAETRKALQALQKGSSEAFSAINAFGQKGPSVMYRTMAAGANYASASIANLR